MSSLDEDNDPGDMILKQVRDFSLMQISDSSPELLPVPGAGEAPSEEFSRCAAEFVLELESECHLTVDLAHSEGIYKQLLQSRHDTAAFSAIIQEIAEHSAHFPDMKDMLLPNIANRFASAIEDNLVSWTEDMKEQCCRAYANKLADKIVAVVDELSESEDSDNEEPVEEEDSDDDEDDDEDDESEGGEDSENSGEDADMDAEELEAEDNYVVAPPTEPSATKRKRRRSLRDQTEASLGDDFDDLMHNELDMPAFVAMCKEYIPAETFADIVAPFQNPDSEGEAFHHLLPAKLQLTTELKHHWVQAQLARHNHAS